MPPKASTASAAAVQAQFDALGIVNDDTWEEWGTGDRCGIEGEAGEFYVQTFRRSGGEWIVNVVGGPVYGQSQTREWRSFDATRLTKKITKRSTKTPKETDDVVQ